MPIAEQPKALSEKVKELLAELEIEKQKNKMLRENIVYAERQNKILYKLYGKVTEDLNVETLFNADERKRLQKFITHKFILAAEAIITLCKLEIPEEKLQQEHTMMREALESVKQYDGEACLDDIGAGVQKGKCNCPYHLAQDTLSKL